MANINEFVTRTILTASDETGAAITSARSRLQSLDDATSRHLGAMKVHYAALAAAATAAFAAISYLIYKAIEQAAEQEVAERRLRQAIGYTSQALLDHAAALKQTTKYSEYQIAAAQAQIAMYTKNEAAIKAATQAAADLASAKGMDLVSASDMIAKTLTTETNVLAKMGVEVEGAVGSTRRLESLTQSISDLFGGQAAAEAETYAGSMALLKNTYGDLLVEIGNLIIKSPVLLELVKQTKKIINDLSDAIKKNKEYFRDNVNDGIIHFIKAMGVAAEVVRFFMNTWYFLKIIASETLNWIVYLLREMMLALRTALTPLTALMEILKNYGLFTDNVLLNGLNGVIEFLGNWQSAQRDVTNQTLEDAAKMNKGIDNVKATIGGVVSALEQAKNKNAEVAAGGGGGGDDEIKRTQADADAIENILRAHEYRKAEIGQSAEDAEFIRLAQKHLKEIAELEKHNATVEEMKRLQQSQTDEWNALVDAKEIDRQRQVQQIKQQMRDSEVSPWQQELNEINYYWDERIRLLEEKGAQEADMKEANRRREVELERAKFQMIMSAASQTFGNLATIAQAYYEMSGKKSKTAFQAYKAMAISQAIIDTIASAQGAYKAMVGIPYVGPILAVIAAAAAIATGMMRVRQIQAMQPGGTTTPSSAGGGGGGGEISAITPTVTPEESARKEEPAHRGGPVINIHVLGNVVDNDGFARSLIPSLSKALADSGVPL